MNLVVLKGFYDHVPPPQEGVPSPDGICTKEGFEYKRLGVRIPTVVVSPYIKKGTLVTYAPEAQKPTATSQYELSSIPATLRKLFPQLGKKPLTKRTAWASTFEHLLGKEMREDCPLRLPEVPPPPQGELERQMKRPIDEHARGLMTSLCQLAGVGESDGCGAGVENYEQFAPWVTAMWGRWHGAS